MEALGFKKECFFAELNAVDNRNTVQKPEGASLGHSIHFEKLNVWQTAIQLVIWTYEIVKNLLSRVPYLLSHQIRKSAISCSMALLNQLIISYKFGFISQSQLVHSQHQIQQITYRINGLYNSSVSKNPPT